jgi:hypothetical protein
MKRRDFIKVSSAAGVLGFIGSGFDASANPFDGTSDGFDLHPFIKEDRNLRFSLQAGQ